jgi:hypothetical protein
MNGVGRLLGWVDRVQQRSRWLGFPFAVMGKFRDDHGGALTTVIAYNAFFALFPLLLVVVTVLGDGAPVGGPLAMRVRVGWCWSSWLRIRQG